MLELQGDLRSLLRESAFFEGIGKLVGFPDAHQKLGLRDQFVSVHAVLFGSGSECREVNICGNVLPSRNFIRIAAD